MLKKKLHDHIELFWEFFKLGMLTVGGGIAMIPLIQRVAVERKKWLSEEDMIDCIARYRRRRPPAHRPRAAPVRESHQGGLLERLPARVH